ncbi:MAG TPA: HAD-IA family hydrolase, partial [Verrucomicrobiae bacterium]|nr:HAD-IA family hydrolase [Verrucomicrobiae bacterium]
MMPPEVVVFDLGKVLVDFDYSRAARAIAARGTTSAETINQLINQSSLLVRYELGQMTDEAFFKEVCSVSGFKGDFEEFGKLFGNIFSEMPPMIELHAMLQKKKVPTYIFSNTNGLAIAHIRRTFPFFANFDDYIFSYEHGVMKPDAGLYEVVERKSNRYGEQILYIDDRPENVAAGAARG